jgi:hypothetical protein
LPYLAQVTTNGAAFEVDQFGAGNAIHGYSIMYGTAISGQGGASDGPSQSQAGGAGVYGVGGYPTVSGANGGNGGNFTGGGNQSTAVVGGTGVLAFGGVSTTVAGDAIVAFGGDSVGGQAGNGIQVTSGQGMSDNLTYGVAGYFNGAVTVSGALNKPGGSFVIDHPTDPEHKYLYHSFVESPDMKNIYDGNVVTDSSGIAVVQMPEWFEALNRDFRYQLTTIGQPAQAWVASKIANGQFVIKTDKPTVEVSWQVTGIRQDAWANANRIPLEVEKAERDQGHYLHPELYGHAGEPDIHELHHPRPVKKQP